MSQLHAALWTAGWVAAITGLAGLVAACALHARRHDDTDDGFDQLIAPLAGDLSLARLVLDEAAE